MIGPPAKFARNRQQTIAALRPHPLPEQAGGRSIGHFLAVAANGASGGKVRS
jgi:hypothetical protein